LKNIIHWLALSCIVVITTVFIIDLADNTSFYASASPQEPGQNITLTVIFNEFNKKGMGKSLVDSAISKLRTNHPDLDINVRYLETVYSNARDQMSNAIMNGTSVDVITVDQIWLGDFAQKNLLIDLTNYTNNWGRQNDWYEVSWDGGVYNDTVFGIWAWTDVRGIWYWKNLLNEANVNPESLKTWDGYIQSAKQLNSALRAKGIDGVHLTGASHSPDIWYPYLWMLGGEIVQLKPGHLTKDTYWFPIYNSTEGVRALQFMKDQVNAGITPQKEHSFGEEFANKTFAVMIEGSWMPTNLPKEEIGSVQFIPMFPVPDKNTRNSTLIGGWEFAIPKTSSHKDLAWGLIELMLQPKILSPWLAEQGYLPTQITIGEGGGPYANIIRNSIPFYDAMVSMISEGRSRPSIPEYPAIAEDIRQAMDEVFYGVKEPKQALDDAAAKSAKALGW
jgi:multiple sugar transport system substrate-binding protein